MTIQANPSGIQNFGGKDMTEKEYLLQARYLDERIHSKVQQVESLNDLATSCSAVNQ